MTRMMPTASRILLAALLALTLSLTGCFDSSGGGAAASATPAASSAASNGVASPAAAPAPVAFASAHYSVAANARSVTLTVTRPDSSAAAASVAYATADGTARAGTDYAAVNGLLRWAENDSSARIITVPVRGGGVTTVARSFRVDLLTPNGGALIGTPGSATVSITAKSSGVGTLQLTSSAYTVSQTTHHRPHNGFGNPSATISVERMGGSSGATSVAYSTRNGTASAGTDYTATSGTLSWADGDSSPKSFAVSVSPISFSGSKSFSVALADPTSGAALGNPGNATVTINGSASAPVGSLQLDAASYAVAQNAGTLTVTVNRSGGSNGAASVA